MVIARIIILQLKISLFHVDLKNNFFNFLEKNFRIFFGFQIFKVIFRACSGGASQDKPG